MRHTQESPIDALTSLLGGMTQVWLNVAFIVCTFIVLTFRPDRIANPSAFKRAIILFTIGLVIPSLGLLLKSVLGSPPRPAGININDMRVAMTHLASTAFFCGAIILATSSLMPRQESE